MGDHACTCPGRGALTWREPGRQPTEGSSWGVLQALPFTATSANPLVALLRTWPCHYSCLGVHVADAGCSDSAGLNQPLNHTFVLTDSDIQPAKARSHKLWEHPAPGPPPTAAGKAGPHWGALSPRPTRRCRHPSRPPPPAAPPHRPPAGCPHHCPRPRPSRSRSPLPRCRWRSPLLQWWRTRPPPPPRRPAPPPRSPGWGERGGGQQCKNHISCWGARGRWPQTRANKQSQLCFSRQSVKGCKQGEW